MAEPQTAWVGDKVEPESFITEIDDITSVTVRYKEEPDFSFAGEQTVSLVLTDEGGNETIVQTTLITENDTEPPKIYGAKKQLLTLEYLSPIKKMFMLKTTETAKFPLQLTAAR